MRDSVLLRSGVRRADNEKITVLKTPGNLADSFFSINLILWNIIILRELH
jgi:hypothetical protein